jgi:hypothetical protein
MVFRPSPFDSFTKDCYVGKTGGEFYTQCVFFSWDSPFSYAAAYCAVGCLVLQTLFTLVLPVVVGRKFTSLPKSEQFLFTSKAVSYVHAWVSGVLSLYVLMNDDDVWYDIAFGSSRMGHVACGITFGYMVYDMATYLFRADADKTIVIHHLVSILALLHTSITRIGFSTTMGFLVTELTTPFLQKRWFLDSIGKSKSFLYMANGLLLWVLWLFFRVGLSVALNWNIWALYPTWAHLPLFIKSTTIIPIIYLALNTLWFIFLTKGVYRALTGKARSPKDLDAKRKKKDDTTPAPLAEAPQPQESMNQPKKSGTAVRQRTVRKEQ